MSQFWHGDPAMDDRETDEAISALSAEANEIVERIIDWYPDAGARRQIVGLMGDAIEAAHSVSGKVWCVTSTKSGQVKLDVGRNAILRLSGEGAVRIALSGSPSEILERVRKIAKKTFSFKGRPRGAIWQLRVADFVVIADDVAGDVVHFATASAESVKSTPYRRYHSAAVVEAVAHLGQRELPQPSYTEAEVRLDSEVAEAEEILHFDGLVAGLVDKGLHFSEETVATYLLALQAKRFVILSGISGTGKTVLALEVALSFQGSASVPGSSLSPPQAPTIVSVKPYNLQHRRLMLPVALIKGHPGFTEVVEERKRVVLKYPGGEQEVTAWKAMSGGTLFLGLAGDVSTWFMETFDEGDPLGLVIEPGEPGVAAAVRVFGPDECGAPAEVRALGLTEADAAMAAPRRYEVVAVRPDWTDNNGLLGFYNPLISDYTSTPFLSLLLRARDEEKRALRELRPAHAFFVILDEMNLARVEHYFSDVLSCLESGEPVVLHDDLALEEQGGVPRTVCVPSNLFFTGTVNVDESTYMFSPKVLDRAFTLEFNEVDLDAYGDAEVLEVENSPLSLQHFPGHLRVQEKPNPKDWVAFRERSPELSGILADLNRVLRRSNRHFGYRVANEIARFMNLAAVQASTSPSTRWCAFDVAVLPKALPKLHGTQQELEATLLNLFQFAVDPMAGTEVRIEDWGVEDGVLRRIKGSREPVRLPRTAGKLFRMVERLRAHGFTSFIE